MKIVFLLDGNRFDGVEIDSRIPVPRIGEFVILGDPGDYHAYLVKNITHSYPAMVVFVYLDYIEK